MKEKLNKLMDSAKNNYKIFIPILLLLVLFISAFIYYNVIVMDTYRETSKDKFYQYFNGKKYEYTGDITTNRRKLIVDFNTKDYEIHFDSTPIYYLNKSRAILPQNMSLVLPTLNCSEYLVKKYSEVYQKKEKYVLKTEKYEERLGNYFFFDGKDTYFLIEETKLKVNGEEIKLSPLSYVVARHNDSISYYDKKNDIYNTITLKDNNATLETENYKVYVLIDNIEYTNSEIILTSKLDALNTIDKKGK